MFIFYVYTLYVFTYIGFSYIFILFSYKTNMNSNKFKILFHLLPLVLLDDLTSNNDYHLISRSLQIYLLLAIFIYSELWSAVR